VRPFTSFLFVPLVIALAGCGGGETSPRDQLPAQYRVVDRYVQSLGVQLDSMEMRYNGLHVRDLVVGEGARADSGDVATVHYTGWLPNGEEFDSSRERSPYPVALGYGRVIQGWDEGVVGMREGGRRQLVIPPGLAYGTTGRGPIPANATLVFDVELLAVEDRTPEG
jgi:FKBP-type peptidyl-prolyl cis-trans isomerase FkpA